MPAQGVLLSFVGDEPDFKGTLRSFIAPPDQLEFERTFDVAIGRFETEQRATWVLWFLWKAYTREQHDSREFEEWVNALAEYEVKEEDAADPTVLPSG